MNASLRLVNCALGLTLVVVLLGGWTRLNDAGLGCPDWPVCYGHLVLPPADQVAERITPHYPGHSVDLYKGWLEMIHRYAASLLGLLVLIQAAWNWRWRNRHGGVAYLSLGLLGLVIVQGAFGMWTVTLKLVPWVVTLHLMGGLTTLALLIRLRQRLCRIGERTAAQNSRDPRVAALLAVLFLQLMLGGWTSTNYAGWACDHWLQCNASGKTEYDFAAGLNPVMQVGPNYEGGLLPAPARAAIQMTHRAGALIVVLMLIWITLSLYRRPALKPWFLLCWGLVLSQIGLGILNVIWQLPLALAIAHHGVAVALWMAVIGLYERAEILNKEVLNGYLSPG